MYFEIIQGEAAIIIEAGTFSQMLFLQGNSGDSYGAYVLTGYGPGSSVRYRMASLFDNSSISISINENTFVITNNSGSNLNATLLMVLGTTPDIS